MVHLLQRDLDPARPRYLSHSSHGWFNPGLSWLDWFKRVGNRQTMDMFCFSETLFFLFSPTFLGCVELCPVFFSFKVNLMRSGLPEPCTNAGGYQSAEICVTNAI